MTTLQNGLVEKGLNGSTQHRPRPLGRKNHVHNLIVKHGKIMIIKRILSSCRTVRPYLALKWNVMRSRWLVG